MRIRALSLTLIGLLALLLVLPWFVGRAIQPKLEQTLSFLSARKLAFELKSYHRGWFTSTATMAVHLKSSSLIGAPEKIVVLKERILHGPFIFDTNPVTGRHEFHAAMAVIHDSIKEDAGQFFGKTLIDYAGDVYMDMFAPSFTLNIQDTVLNVKGLSETLSIEHNENRFYSELRADQLSIKHNKMVQTIDGLNARVDINRHNAVGLWLGHEALQVKQLNLTTPTYPRTTIKGLFISGNSNEAQQKIHSLFRVSVDSTQQEGSPVIGPHRLSVDIMDVDATALFQLSRQLILVQQATSFDPLIIHSLVQNTLETLAKGLTVELTQLELNTFWGTLTAQGQFTLHSQPPKNHEFSELLNPLDGKLTATFPKELANTALTYYYDLKSIKDPDKTPAQQAKASIDQLTQEGYLKESETEPSDYTLNITIKQGKLVSHD